jgi:diadenylate cyclase
MVHSAPLLETLRMLAPGTEVRDGIDRILLGRGGALIVIGDDPRVLSICSGGFLLDAEFTPQRLSELAKMDGAIILNADCTRVARANVQLMPDPTIRTTETGTRHRTAERVARQIDVPVISVSEDMAVVTIYRGEVRHTLMAISRILDRANPALQTLQRYKSRFDTVMSQLSAHEIEDLTSVRDVALAIMRSEMVRRIAVEIDGYVIELGADGRLILLQLEEMMAGVVADRFGVLRDYLPLDRIAEANSAVELLTNDEVLNVRAVAETLTFDDNVDLDDGVSARGYRMLGRLPRLSDDLIDEVVDHFGTLHEIIRASMDELMAVPSVSQVDAQNIKDGLSRLAEVSMMDRFA